MKKLFFGSLALCAALLFAPVQSSAEGVKFLEIKVVSVKVWPVKPSGKCWDPCFMKKYQLPARGNKDFSKYFGNQNFRKVCTGSKAPDPLVEIKVGKYEKFTTDKINNQCNPSFNVKKVFRIPQGAAFSVAVYDNDGGANVQVKRDLMGVKAWGAVPAALANGGRLVIKSFGQVEELVLEAKVVKRKVSTGCAGTYKVRVVEFEVKPRKASGKPWDRGFGRFKKPDVLTVLKIGGTTVSIPKQQDTLSRTFPGNSHAGTVAIKKGQTVKIGLYDKDGFGRKETIGEDAVGDVCTIIKAGGKHTFTNFGQVTKAVVIFTKTK